MRVKKIQLSNFRNHKESALDFSDGINFITGANDTGKNKYPRSAVLCLFYEEFSQANGYGDCKIWE